jgi:ribose transport system substrate-binding protein
LVHGDGRVIVITIPGQLNLDERVRGITEAFKKFPGIKIGRTLDDKGDPRSANDQISALMDAKEKIDGIVCVEASGGPGAAEALHRLNLGGKIPVVAMDKTPETLDFIAQGIIAATVSQKLLIGDHRRREVLGYSVGSTLHANDLFAACVLPE